MKDISLKQRNIKTWFVESRKEKYMVKGIEIDRCSFCNNFIGLSDGKYGIELCKAFPDGVPSKFNEFSNPGCICNGNYKFELNEEMAEEYKRLFGPIEENKHSSNKK
ncbi:MAG: hypothetical protein PUJ25_05980 [Lachnospiraceae bacterium]|nr:hypothetical protein [Lachnospiraceae bacterium]MDD7665133.1 hypothetical protein [Lachnospiraceae bacterium]MDY4164075.1 hypothetical protein [Lachnospiraceae bacterium]